MFHKKIISVAFCFVLFILFASTAKAQVVNYSGGSLTIPNQGILPESGNIEVFGINMNDSYSDTYLTSITVTFEGYNNPTLEGDEDWNFDISDIERVAVYMDNQGDLSGTTPINGNGVFSNTDILIGEVLTPTTLTITISCGGQEIPNYDTGMYTGNDFFVVINTSNTIRDDDPSTYPGYFDNEGHAFTITIKADDGNAGTLEGIRCSNDNQFPTTPDLVTDIIYCEAWADDETPFSLYYNIDEYWGWLDDLMYPGNGYNDWERYRYSVPDEWIRPGYDENPTTPHAVPEDHWPLSQLLPMEVRTPVLGIACAGGTTDNRAYLDSVTITFTGDFDPSEGFDHLRDWTWESSWWPFSGVILYRHTGGEGWSESDTIVPVSYGGSGWNPVGGNVWTLTLYPHVLPGEAIPLAANGLTNGEPGFDYFIVLRADSGFWDLSGDKGDKNAINFGATFTVSITASNVNFSNRPATNPADPGYLNNPSQPCIPDVRYGTDVKPIHPVVEIHDMVARTDVRDNEGYSYQRIDATSPATPIFGINITDTTDANVLTWNGAETFQWVTVYLYDDNVPLATSPSDYFKPLSTNETSGLSLWMDNKAAGQLGVFDSQDTFIQLWTPSWQSAVVAGVWSAVLTPVDYPQVAGDDVYDASNRGDDFFVCVKTSDTLSYNNRFHFEIKDGGVKLAHHQSAGGSGIIGRTLTANFPVFLTNLTSSGQRIEPLSSPTAVIGINTWDDTGSGGKLEQVIVEFYNYGDDSNFHPEYDLLHLDSGSGSGVALYKDTNGNGVFDLTIDTVVPLSEFTWNHGVSGEPLYQCKLVPTTPLLLPANDTAGNHGADYFIVIRTNNETMYRPGDDFSVGIVSWGPEGSTWGSRALGFVDKNSIQTRSYERIQTNVVGYYAEPPPPPEGPGSLGGDGLGCFIATACYGTPMAKEVRVLSNFRDEYLVTNSLGRFFVKTYYKTSPKIADFISEHPQLKKFIRIGLKPLVHFSKILVDK